MGGRRPDPNTCALADLTPPTPWQAVCSVGSVTQQNSPSATTDAAAGTPPRPARLAAAADLHFGRSSQGTLDGFVEAVNASAADLLLLAGDLTDFGLAEEAEGLARTLFPAIRIPVVGVLGNHDYESDRADEVASILREAGMTLLDGEAVEVAGIGIAGTPGFPGGFGRGSLGVWGEPLVKAFARGSVAEALKLESALARLRTRAKVALLHYAPLAATVEGEPREIYPWLGSSRLEEPLTRFEVAVAFHGHAHCGSPEGRTAGGAVVYNVSLPLLRREGAWLRLIELER